MVVQFNKSAPGAYYRQALAYYSNGTSSFWFAPNNRLGVTDGEPVDFTAFEHLYSGADANGVPLYRNSGGHIIDRVPAFDMTLSVFKTLSMILAFAPSELKGPVLEAIRESAVETLEVGQELAGYRRRGKGGMQLEKVPLTAAVFLHPDSRPAPHSDGQVFSDMNSHFHAVFFNTCVSDDGTAGSIHSMLLRMAKMPMGATLHAALAYWFMKLGFSIEVTGPNGLFEVTGISPELIEYFSARRNEIKDELAVAGTTSTASPALAAKTAVRTRLTKLDQTQEERQEIWREACLRLGFNPDDIVPLALAVGQVVDEVAGEVLYRRRLEALA